MTDYPHYIVVKNQGSKELLIEETWTVWAKSNQSSVYDMKVCTCDNKAWATCIATELNARMRTE